MTTYTIIPADSTVYVDGEAQTVDMTDMPDYAHAVQWHGNYGEIEFRTDANGRRLPNLRFTDFSPFQFMITRWEERKQQLADQMTLFEQQQAATLEAQRAAEAARAEGETLF